MKNIGDVPVPPHSATVIKKCKAPLFAHHCICGVQFTYSILFPYMTELLQIWQICLKLDTHVLRDVYFSLYDLHFCGGQGALKMSSLHKVIRVITQQELETKKEAHMDMYVAFFKRKSIQDPVRFTPRCYSNWHPLTPPSIKLYLAILIRHLNRKTKVVTFNIGIVITILYGQNILYEALKKLTVLQN